MGSSRDLNLNGVYKTIICFATGNDRSKKPLLKAIKHSACLATSMPSPSVVKNDFPIDDAGELINVLKTTS